MISKEYIRDYTGKCLGTLETQQNGDIIVREFSGKMLGKYDKAANVTRDMSGRMLYKGNMAAMLIQNK